MKQVFIIHGGDSFLSHKEYIADLKNTDLEYDRIKPKKSWRDAIIEQLRDADVLTPTMPNSANAQYAEWEIWFEKIVPHFGDEVRLIGHSLGAMFLAKYLHSNQLASPVKQLHLVAGGYDGDKHGYGSFSVDSAKGLENSAEEIHLYHSRDDFVVPFSKLTKYRYDLPSAHVHAFDDRNHFLGPEFPELIEILKQK